MNFIKDRRLWVVIAMVVLGIFIYRFAFANDTKKAVTYTVRPQNLKETLSFSGTVEAEEAVTLRFATSGRLNWVGVKQGDYVSKFQTIASLDKREVQKNLEKYLNSYMSQRWDFEDDKKNYDTRLTDDLKKVLEKAQFDLNSSVVDVELKSLAVEYANLWTPIEGLVVIADSPQAGVNVIPTQAEFQIINPKTIYFLASADQTDVVKISANQPGIITLDPYPDQKLPSAISQISFIPKSNETGTVYEVKMALSADNSDYRYRVGMTGDAEFILKEIPNAIAIPTKYIKTEQNQKYVWLNLNGKRQKQVITVGETFDTLAEIKSGLKEGDIIFET